MSQKRQHTDKDVLEYQPDAVEIEEKPVAGKVRWVLYVILITLVGVGTGAALFKVDRIVVAEGKLITAEPTIVVQPLNTSIIRSIDVEVGDMVVEGQILATLDSTFTSADLSQLQRQKIALSAQLRRIEAELENRMFAASPDEGEDGRLQESFFRQRRVILEKTRQMSEDRKAALESKRALNRVRQEGSERQLKVLRDVEGVSAALPQNGVEYRLRLLESQQARYQKASEVESLKAEEDLIANELRQVESEWQQFVEERMGDLMEEKLRYRNELEKVIEESSKAERLQELVFLRAPQSGIVLNMASRSVGSILQQAEPFITLVPGDSRIEVEVNVESKDIARIRFGDPVRVKLDAFPFQRHDTLAGKVRVISEDTIQHQGENSGGMGIPDSREGASSFYRSRIELISHKLKNVPEGFRLMPGMKVRAEIKVGQRRVISYFLYPLIRALDEGLREP